MKKGRYFRLLERIGKAYEGRVIGVWENSLEPPCPILVFKESCLAKESLDEIPNLDEQCREYIYSLFILDPVNDRKLDSFYMRVKKSNHSGLLSRSESELELRLALRGV